MAEKVAALSIKQWIGNKKSRRIDLYNYSEAKNYSEEDIIALIPC